LEINTLNVGIFVGMDTPVNNSAIWYYSNKPWLGFGIGYSLGMFSKGNSQG
jgi:hypothetical protein